jgi:hypothetical protein
VALPLVSFSLVFCLVGQGPRFSTSGGPHTLSASFCLSHCHVGTLNSFFIRFCFLEGLLILSMQGQNKTQPRLAVARVGPRQNKTQPTKTLLSSPGCSFFLRRSSVADRANGLHLACTVEMHHARRQPIKLIQYM